MACFGPNSSTVSLNDGARYRQPHAQAFRLGGKKWIEYFLQVVRGNTGSKIGNGHLSKRSIQLCSAPDDFALSVRRVGYRIHSVYDQIKNNLLNLNPVTLDLQHLRSRDIAYRNFARTGLDRKKVKNFTHHLIEVKIFYLGRGLLQDTS